MAESENVYVKIGERGRLIERTATSPRDHVNLRGTGWVLKGDEGAPTKKDEFADTLTRTERAKLTDSVPTSVKAYAAAADADSTGTKTATRTGRGSSSASTAAGSAGEAADAASQAAAGR